MSSSYRLLRPEEIAQLERQNCHATSWSEVTVHSSFDANALHRVTLSGTIHLGCFAHTFTLPGGVEKQAGIRNATLHNCTVGNHVLIENVHNYIANYTIGDYAYIQNLNTLYVEGESSFGNGTEVSVLNETGGREVPIYNTLSAHLAYIVAMYRHRPKLIERTKELIQAYTKQHSSTVGEVGEHAFITNSGTIKNVKIGAYSRINGASRLEDGSINSNIHHPVVVGENVVATHFILSSGTHVSDGVVLLRSFLGQATHLSHLFSAHDSLFFSNCQGENGEACAIFAGPYTVTMHKSSLLIAGMFSFLNAGSGSNQSNHMYKLGPIHQGVVERGSKTTSDSYILWPAKIGAFSLIMGRHVEHPDTSRLPFSYLIETNQKTLVVPGVNLKSVGTIRDAQKWPKRDNRKDPHQLDQINFNLLSPYTIQRMMQAVAILQSLPKGYDREPDIYPYQNLFIKRSSLHNGIGFYTKAIHKFLGNSLIKRLEGIEFASEAEMRQRLLPTHPHGEGEWIDLSGLIAPKREVERLLDEIEQGAIHSIEEIEERFATLHKEYYDMEWSWAYRQLLEWYSLSPEKITAADVIAVVEAWKEAVVSLDNLLHEDAAKEFSLASKTGFGMDGDLQQRNYDFEQVRGDFENNPFVTMVRHHIETKTALGNELIARLGRIESLQ